jgi:hypothetical protein
MTHEMLHLNFPTRGKTWGADWLSESSLEVLLEGFHFFPAWWPDLPTIPRVSDHHPKTPLFLCGICQQGQTQTLFQHLLYIIYIHMCPLFILFACYFISYSNFNVSLVWANSCDKCFLWVSYVSNICQLLQVTFRSVSATIAIYAMTGIWCNPVVALWWLWVLNI